MMSQHEGASKVHPVRLISVGGFGAHTHGILSYGVHPSHALMISDGKTFDNDCLLRYVKIGLNSWRNWRLRGYNCGEALSL